jgi:Cu(I)/Ag(I) efflux system membrane fusion protein
MTAAVVLAVGHGLAVVPSISAADAAFSSIANDYDAIHEALVEDSLAGVNDHALAIARTADEALADLDAGRAQVAVDDVTTVRELLPEVVDRARTLAEATDLQDARALVAQLTQPLSRWQRLVRDPKPVVAYCPMVRRAWLQDDGFVENPYDPTMLRCGTIVQR